MISVPDRRLRKRPWRAILAYFAGSTMLHFIFLPLLATLFGLRVLMPEFQPEVYHVTSSAVRIEHQNRPMRSAIPQPHVPRPPQKTTERRNIQRVQGSVRTPTPVRIAYRPPPRPKTVPIITPHQQIDPKTLAAQQRMFAATIAAAQAANNPLSVSRSERSPTAITHVNYNFAGSEAASRHGDGILYPIKRWTDGKFVYYYLRYTVHYPSGDYEAGEVPWPVRYPIGEDPFAHGLTEHIPLPGPAPDFVASADTIMKPLIAHCYRLREQYCAIMPAPQ